MLKWSPPRAFLIVLACTLLISCDDETSTRPSTTVVGSGQVLEDVRMVEGFFALAHGSVGAVHVTLGENEGLRIVAEDNMIDEILTDVVEGVLRIRTRSGVSLRPSEPIDIYLEAKTLQSLALTGVGLIDGPRLVGESLDLSIGGVGDIVFPDVEAQTLTLVVSGVGDARLGGSTVDEVITVTGVAEIDLDDLAAVHCDVQIAGSASVRVRVSDSLSFVVSGEADLCYIGEPQVETSIAGSGTISTCD